MRDAVAEVLADRIHVGERRIRASVVVSVTLHLVLFGLVLVGAHRPPVDPRPTVVNIRLAAARPAPITAAPSRPSAPAPVKAAEAPVPQVVTPPKPVAPQTVAEAKPVKKEPFAPKEESVFGRSNKPVAPQPAPSAPPAQAAPSTTAAEGTGAAAVPAVGTAGVTGLEGGDFPYTIYVDQMVAKIGRNWLRPQTRGEPLAVVYFVIDRDGTIRNVDMKKYSGSDAFDRAARRAIFESSPLAPLPFAYRGTWLGVHLTFH